MTDAKVNIERELELIDGMIEVQLHHAEQCDRMANRTMAEKQKGCDMERVALLRKMRAALAPQPADPSMDTTLRNAARRSATIVDRGRMVKPVEPVAWPMQADPFTYIIQHLNSSTYNMTKAECIHFIGKLRDHYAAPPAPAAVPLTVSEIERMWSDAIMNGADGAILFARAIERAHGIAAAGDKP